MVRYILFDLDETLYPATSGLMRAVGERMREYLQNLYSLPPEQAALLQKRFWDDYGTTLRGLMQERKIDPQHYLEYVHDVQVSQFLAPDMQLRDILENLPQRKVIVTNGDVPHAQRVLNALGVADLFDDVYDIVFMDYECKPARGAYERVLSALDVRGEECILVEDMPRNLPPARALGIRTILLQPDPNTPVARFPGFDQEALTACPPDANLCIASIYEVGDAIRALTNHADITLQNSA